MIAKLVKSTLVPMLAAVVLVTITMPAARAATFDPATGTGHASAGEVQKAFGWNGKTMQANAADISFSLFSIGEWAVSCSGDQPWNDRAQVRVVADVVSSLDAMTHGRRTHVKGYDFTGIQINSSSLSYLPADGSACGQNGIITVSRTPVPVTLSATYGGSTVVIEQTTWTW